MYKFIFYFVENEFIFINTKRLKLILIIWDLCGLSQIFFEIKFRVQMLFVMDILRSKNIGD